VNVRIAKRLTQLGYHVLRFDFTGLGQSGGDFRDSTFVANVGDLVKAATWMLDEGYGPSAMLGHSLGGAATLIAAGRLRTVKSVAVIGAPSSARHVLAHIAIDDQQRAQIEGCTEVELVGRTFPISNQFLSDLDAYDSAQAVGSLGLPLAILHSPDDLTVPISEGERLFSLAAQPKAFFPLVGADHLLTEAKLAETAADVIAAWFDLTGAGAFG
jgi:putative redox protein